MFTAINGWTKAKILKVIRARRYNAPAVSEGTCAYLTKNGNRCAVGLFIPKGHEGSSLFGDVTELLGYHPDLESKMPLTTTALKRLQRVHDDCSVENNGTKNLNAKEAMIAWVKANVE